MNAPPRLVDPLAWLAGEHNRQRQLCDTLAETAAMQTAAPGQLRRLADALATDTALHIADEAEDLFPRLRQRLEPEDEIARVLGILTADHDAEQAALPGLQSALMAASPGLAAMIGPFVARKRRHIALVNAVLLPIARLRLTPDDRDGMARSMAARRAD